MYKKTDKKTAHLVSDFTNIAFTILVYFLFFLDLKKSLKYLQQLRFHSVSNFELICRQLHMATYLRQLHFLLYKNVISKYRHKLQAIMELVLILLIPGLLAVYLKSGIIINYDATPSSEQIKYNFGQVTGEKRQHLAYVTNVNASEFQFFLWFYCLLYLFDKGEYLVLTKWVKMTNPQFRKKRHP